MKKRGLPQAPHACDDELLALVDEVGRVEDLDGLHADVRVLGAQGYLPQLVELHLAVLAVWAPGRIAGSHFRVSFEFGGLFDTVHSNKRAFSG